jgi:hypothetical protein
VTPSAPPSPDQKVKVLHPGTARYTKGREPIDRCFQERMRHPKASPSSVLGTRLSPWHLTPCAALANAHTHCAGHHPSAKPTWPHCHQPNIWQQLSTGRCGPKQHRRTSRSLQTAAAGSGVRHRRCWPLPIASGSPRRIHPAFGSPASMSSPDPRVPTPNHQCASMRPDLTGGDGFVVHVPKSEDRRPRQQATTSPPMIPPRCTESGPRRRLICVATLLFSRRAKPRHRPGRSLSRQHTKVRRCKRQPRLWLTPP